MNAYRRAVELKPRFGPGWLNLGELLQAAGRKSEAENCFHRALANPIRSARELSRVAAFCRDRGWFLAAATNFAEAATLNPTDVSTYILAGQSYSAAGNPTQAQHFFAEAVRLDPNYGPARFLFGRELGKLRNDSGAEEQFREAVRLMPEVAEARLNLATSLRNQGRNDEAAAQYALVLERWPTNLLARQNLEALQPAAANAKPVPP